ncbi:MAG: hypothetical protein P8X39_07510, partial [Desulfofustis sp.]
MMKENHVHAADRYLWPTLLFVMAGMIMGAISLAQASSDGDVSKDVKEAAAAIGDYSVEQKDKAVTEANELI